MTAGAGRRRRAAKKAMKQGRALFWTRRLFEGGVIDVDEVAMRVKRIYLGGVK